MNVTEVGNKLAQYYIVALMRRQEYTEIEIADVLESWKRE